MALTKPLPKGLYPVKGVPVPLGSDRLELIVGMVFEQSGGGAAVPASNGSPVAFNSSINRCFNTGLFQAAKAGCHDRIMANVSHNRTGSAATGLGYPQGAQPGAVISV